MSDHLKWLLQQRARFQEEFEKAQKKLAACEEMLKTAQEEGSIAHESAPPRSKRSTGEPTIIALTEQILRQYGPLTSKQIQELLAKEDRQTTINSLNTSLYRLKGKKFEKDRDGRWYLSKKQQGGPDNSEAAMS